MPAPTITPLPTPPSRSTDPTNFSIEADAFVAALPEFVTDANAQATYLDGVASAVDADAAAAAASAAAALVSENNAEAAAAAAAATADAELWVSGTTYAIGDNVFSPINFQTYRRKTNGAGTTDPSLDGANWEVLTFYAATPLQVVGNAAAGAELRLPEDTDNGNHYVALKAPNAIASNVTFTLPAADGTSGQVLATNGSGQLDFATPGATNFQEFATSGTWTKPVGAQFVMVEAWGAGGGGASGRRGTNDASTYNGGGTGGGGGAYVRQVYKASDLPATVSVTIAAGGVGGAAITTDNTNGLNGTSGGNSTFGTLITARGGANGVFTTSTGGTGTGALGGQGGHSIPGSIRPGFGTGTADITWPASFGPMLYRSSERFDVNVPSSGYAGGSGGGVGSARDAYAGGGSLLGGAGGGAGGGTTVNAGVKLAAAGGSDYLENGGGGGAGVAGIVGSPGGSRQGGGGGASGVGTSMYGILHCGCYNPTANKYYIITTSGPIMEVSSAGVPNFTAVGAFTTGATPTNIIFNSGTYVVTSNTGIWTSTNLISWTLRRSGSFNYVSFGNGRYVAVGSNLIAWSTDLVNWTSVTSISDNLTMIKFDGTRFVMIGTTNNNIYHSTDGNTWTTVTKPSALADISNVASSGSILVVYGWLGLTGSDVGSVYYSTDLGLNWLLATNTDYQRTWRDASYGFPFIEFHNGNFYFFAITAGAGGTVVRRSSNATSWTAVFGAPWDPATLEFNTTDNSSIWSKRRSFNGSEIGSYTANATTTNWGAMSGTAAFTTGAATIGGAGGFPAGGGGGGGGTINTFNSGAGGAGGAGLVRVYSW